MVLNDFLTIPLIVLILISLLFDKMVCLKSFVTEFIDIKLEDEQGSNNNLTDTQVLFFVTALAHTDGNISFSICFNGIS